MPFNSARDFSMKYVELGHPAASSDPSAASADLGDDETRRHLQRLNSSATTALKAVPLQLIQKGDARQTEASGCFGLVACGILKGLREQRFFQAFDLFPEGGGVSGRGCGGLRAARRMQSVHVDGTTVTQRD